jgi:hypothetical protein
MDIVLRIGPVVSGSDQQGQWRKGMAERVDRALSTAWSLGGSSVVGLLFKRCISGERCHRVTRGTVVRVRSLHSIEIWCPEPDSNRHRPFGPRDFKSLVSTYSTIRAGSGET